jgi:hypothetical protein
MTAYLIVYGRDPQDRLAAYACQDRNAARYASLSTLVPRVPPDGPAGGCAYIIETESDVTFSGRLLLDVYNGLAGDNGHVNRFESRTTGVQRLLALLPTISSPTTEVSAMSTHEANGAVADRRGRKMKYVSQGAVIHVVQPNPYRAGTKRHSAFALYRDGMTAQEFLAAGGKTYDLNRAIKDGLITAS